MTGAGRPWPFILFSWLTAATILAHALVPIGSPLARSAGSAFSASTTDVAVKPGKQRAPVDATCEARSPDGEVCESKGADAPALAQHWFAWHAPPGEASTSFAHAPPVPAHSPQAFAFRARAPPRA